MTYELTGKIIEIHPTVEVSSSFKKRDFVVEKSESHGDRVFTDTIKFQLIQDRCVLMDACKVGDEVKITFNIKGSKWEKEGKVSYFVNLDAWRVERLNVATSQNVQEAPPANYSDFNTPLPEVDDTLPF